VVRKKLNAKRHLVALILTLAFFTIGILIGSMVTNQRIDYLQGASSQQNIDFESLQTQYLYVSLMKDNNSCQVVEETFKANVENLEDTRKQLEEFIKKSQINQEAYTLLKREYVIAQFRYWLLAESTKEVCNRDLVTLFYFFSNPQNCDDCNNQGIILTYLKKIFNDKLLIFSFDAELENEPIIPILKKVYNVTEFPTIILENERYNGLQEKDMLFEQICEHFENEYQECNSS
tara:strand:- start:3143 stop:3841 length:699 start_codon:yes stop_codon:yes gene_type:complete